MRFMASHYEDTATATPSHRWEEAGEAWGSRAIDWSCLYEHYSLDMLVALLPRLGVGPGTSLLDVACGSGLAVRVADGMGADVAGIDAAAELVAVACDRTPTADLRVGSMFELPWTDGRFDAVLSVNGIWGGCGKALDEIHRVLRPGGRVAISFWGQGPPLDIREVFKVFAFHAPEQHRDSMRQPQQHRRAGRRRGDVGERAASRCSNAAVASRRWNGRTRTRRGGRYPAWARRSPRCAQTTRTTLRGAVLAALEPCRDSRGVYRTRSDHQFVVAMKRPTE